MLLHNTSWKTNQSMICIIIGRVGRWFRTLFSRKKFRFYVLLPYFYWLVLGFFYGSLFIPIYFWRWFEYAATTITGL